VHPGTEPPGLFFIQSGDCVVFSSSSVDLQLHKLQRGDFFGEEALVNGVAVNGVRATEPSTMWVLLRAHLNEFLDRYPDLREQIMRSKRKMLVRRNTLSTKNLASALPPATADADGVALSPLRGFKRGFTVTDGVTPEKSTFKRGFKRRDSSGEPKKPLETLTLPVAFDESGEHDILLVRAEWFIEQWQTGGRLMRRQDMPDEAFYRGKLDLRALVVISYPWLTREHPDPDGFHLEALARMLGLFCENFGEAAVFIDFCCLFQVPRTEEEQSRFDKSFPGLKKLYAHQASWVWIMSALPPGYTGSAYDTRGWCSYEKAISAWVKDPMKLIDNSMLGEPLLDKLAECTSWHVDVHSKCNAYRKQPLSPSAFENVLTEKAFSVEADKPLVAALYRDVFAEVFIQVRELDFSGLGWTHVDNLADTLAAMHEGAAQLKTRPALKFVWLFDNPIADRAGAHAQLQRVVGNNCYLHGLDGEA